jgi:hypothetical protein
MENVRKNPRDLRYGCSRERFGSMQRNFRSYVLTDLRGVNSPARIKLVFAQQRIHLPKAWSGNDRRSVRPNLEEPLGGGNPVGEGTSGSRYFCERVGDTRRGIKKVRRIVPGQNSLIAAESEIERRLQN